MFVCLWSPAWRTVADSLAELSPALLTVTPRVVTEERRGGLVWVDARGLDADRVARDAIGVLLRLGLSNVRVRSEEHTSELQSQSNLVCRLLLEKKKKK